MSIINWIAFGGKIKEKRKDVGLSQVALAVELGVSQPVVSLAERGSPIGINEERLELIKNF